MIIQIDESDLWQETKINIALFLFSMKVRGSQNTEEELSLIN